MATSQRTGMRKSALTMAVQMVIPAGGAVLRDGSFRHVHVDIEMAIEVVRQSQAGGARADVTHRGLRRFLHHVAQFAGER